MDQGHLTAEEAALEGYSPAARARVRASAVNAERGRGAFVIDTEPSHPLEVNCVREGDCWFDGGSGTGWTWAAIGDEVGFQTAWDEVPAGVTAVRVKSRDRVVEVPVSDGMFLFVDWNVPAAEIEPWPQVVGYLRRDGWQELDIDRIQLKLERLLGSPPPIGWRRLLPRWWRVKRISLKSSE